MLLWLTIVFAPLEKQILIVALAFMAFTAESINLYVLAILIGRNFYGRENFSLESAGKCLLFFPVTVLGCVDDGPR